MAAAHYPGGLRPHPPGLRPGPRPSSEMARQVRTGAAAGGHLLAGRGTGATEPPPRARAPPASRAGTLRVTLDQPGEPAAQGGEAGGRDAEIPGRHGRGLAGTRQAQVADCGQHGAGTAADQVALEAAYRAGCFKVSEPAEEALDVAASQRGRLVAPVGPGAQAFRQPGRRADDVADIARPGAAVPGQ